MPYIRFGVDDAHVGLVCAAVHENPVVHLKKGVLGIVLRHVRQKLYEEYTWLTGAC